MAGTWQPRDTARGTGPPAAPGTAMGRVPSPAQPAPNSSTCVNSHTDKTQPRLRASKPSAPVRRFSPNTLLLKINALSPHQSRSPFSCQPAHCLCETNSIREGKPELPPPSDKGPRFRAKDTRTQPWPSGRGELSLAWGQAHCPGQQPRHRHRAAAALPLSTPPVPGVPVWRQGGRCCSLHPGVLWCHDRPSGRASLLWHTSTARGAGSTVGLGGHGKATTVSAMSPPRELDLPCSAS